MHGSIMHANFSTRPIQKAGRSKQNTRASGEDCGTTIVAAVSGSMFEVDEAFGVGGEL